MSFVFQRYNILFQIEVSFTNGKLELNKLLRKQNLSIFLSYFNEKKNTILSGTSYANTFYFNLVVHKIFNHCYLSYINEILIAYIK